MQQPTIIGMNTIQTHHAWHKNRQPNILKDRYSNKLTYITLHIINKLTYYVADHCISLFICNNIVQLRNINTGDRLVAGPKEPDAYL